MAVGERPKDAPRQQRRTLLRGWVAPRPVNALDGEGEASMNKYRVRFVRAAASDSAAEPASVIIKADSFSRPDSATNAWEFLRVGQSKPVAVVPEVQLLIIQVLNEGEEDD